MGRHKNLDDFVNEVRGRQRNIAFPDTFRNPRLVDVFLWRGSPHPTPVQRIAAWMFGLVFLCSGSEFFYLAVTERIKNGFSSGVVVLVGLSLTFVFSGARIFRNGFSKGNKPVDTKPLT